MLETYDKINSNYHKLNIEHDPEEVNGAATKIQICNPLLSDLECHGSGCNNHDEDILRRQPSRDLVKTSLSQLHINSIYYNFNYPEIGFP